MRERIQINNEPISEQLFSKYFFDVWDRLSVVGDGSKPVYFRFLTLMAFHVFLQEHVDTAVIECGIGGEYDSTNLFVSPSVTAVTALGIDHVGMLGNTIEEIAWHKAGVFKTGALALTVPQLAPAMEVLRERARAKSVDLQVVDRHPQIASGEVKLGLAADFQKSNASLAVAICRAHLHQLGHQIFARPMHEGEEELPIEFKRGLELVKWPGRCEKRLDGRSRVVWYLDGGHTLESIEVAGQWYAEEVQKEQTSKIPEIRGDNSVRILIFNQQTRDAASLARALFKTLSEVLGPKPFSHVIFTTNITFKALGYKPDLIAVNNNDQDVQTMRVQKELARVWIELDRDAETQVTPTIEEAVEIARRVAEQFEDRNNGMVMCLITGSLHLVGGALEVLEGADAK